MYKKSERETKPETEKSNIKEHKGKENQENYRKKPQNNPSLYNSKSVYTCTVFIPKGIKHVLKQLANFEVMVILLCNLI